MSVLRFIHAADLHLGSPFKGLKSLDRRQGEVLIDATFAAFNNIIETCLARKADFLLVAGDVFDAEDRGLKAQLKFRNGLGLLGEKGIRSFVVHGNHDPLSGWAEQIKWPASVKIFGDTIETVPYDRDGEILAHIQGASYPRANVRENLAARFSRPSPSPFAIALLHANVGSNTGHEAYAPCALEDLLRSGFDYWALGHVHKKSVIQERNPGIVYPGNPQGLHINEQGSHGVYYLCVKDGKIAELEFIPVDMIRWRNLTGGDSLDVSKASKLDDVEALAREKCRSLLIEAESRSVIIRMALTGRTFLHKILSQENVLSDLESILRESFGSQQPFLWIDSIESKTRAPLDMEARRNSQDFIAEMLRLTHTLGTDAGELEETGKSILSPLYGSRSLPGEIVMPQGEELGDILQDAETLLLDHLIQEEAE